MGMGEHKFSLLLNWNSSHR